jgi:hypothetical protein
VFSAHAIEQKGRADINSVVPLKNGIKLKFDNLKKAQVHTYKELVPAELDDNRIPKRYIVQYSLLAIKLCLHKEGSIKNVNTKLLPSKWYNYE